jgi:spore germination protein KB
MKRTIISDRQGVAISTLFIWGSTLLVGTAGEAKKDIWLAMLLGMLLGAVVIILYCKIINTNPGWNVFDINELVFGRLFGSLINIAYIWFAYSLGALVMNNFSEFITIVGMPDSPMVYGIVPLIIICIWGVKAGIEVLGRWSEFFIIILIAIMIFSNTFSIPSFEWRRILPVLQEGIKPVLKGAFTAFTFPFGETVLFLMVSSCFKDRKSPYKSLLIGLTLSGVLVTIFAVRNIFVIGPEMLSRSYFPSYTALSTINVGEFVQRIETAVTVSFLITGFIKISICILAACNGLTKLFRLEDYHILVTPVALTVFATSFIVFENIIEAVNFTQQVSPYYKTIFIVILPIITYIGIKTRGKKVFRNQVKEK